MQNNLASPAHPTTHSGLKPDAKRWRPPGDAQALWHGAWIAILVSLFALPAFAQNLVKNGDFEAGTNKLGEPIGWHTVLTSYTSLPEYKDPEHKQGRTGVVHFRCACGYDWGTVRPFATLICPKCHHMVTGLEESAGFYFDNDKYVSLADGPNGKELVFKLPTDVGNNQGARALSDLIPAHRGEGYEIRFNCTTKGASMRAFVECFTVDRDADNIKDVRAWLKTLPPESNPMRFNAPLKRVFRQQIYYGDKVGGNTYAQQFMNEGHYSFDYMMVSLYSYIPGELSYDHVVLRKLSEEEVAAWHQKNKDNPMPEGLLR